MQKEAAEPQVEEGRRDRTLAEYIGLAFRGACMGAADIVPGVSGGTMAFILGIYEELINSIRTIGRPKFIQAVARLRIKEVFQILNWPFLLAVGGGIFFSILTMSSILETLLVEQPVYLWSFFFGLILASIVTVSKRIDKWSPSLLAAVAIGAIGAFILVGLVPLQTPDGWWFLLLSGALASCAMILPGISGAFILVLLGKYQFVLAAVNDRDFVSLGFIAVGAGLGLVTFAQILGYLFKRYHDITVAVLIGLMVGSLRKVWPWKLDVAWLEDAAGNRILDSHGELIVSQQQNFLPSLSNAAGEVALAIVLMFVGIGLILLLDRLAGDKGQGHGAGQKEEAVATPSN
jgi:putative membrane protein